MLLLPWNKTTQEAQKLQKVQSELQKIDQIVASDVNLLRKTIEEASYEYMEARLVFSMHRYDIIELNVLRVFEYIC